MSSADPAFNGIFAEGIQLNVAGSTNTGKVIVSQTDGETMVVENGGAERQLQLTMAERAAGDHRHGRLHDGLRRTGFLQGCDTIGGNSVEVSTATASTSRQSIVLTFDSTNRRELERGTDDLCARGERRRDGRRAHGRHQPLDGTNNGNAATTGATIANVEVAVIDNDKAGLIVRAVGRQHHADRRHIERHATRSRSTRQPATGEIVTVTLNFDTNQINAISGTRFRLPSFWSLRRSALPVADHLRTRASTSATPSRSTRATGARPSTSSCSGDRRCIAENRATERLTHSHRAAAARRVLHRGGRRFGDRNRRARQRCRRPGRIAQSDGSTIVSESQPDTYGHHSSPSAPTAPVTVSIMTDGKTIASRTSTRPGELPAASAWWTACRR